MKITKIEDFHADGGWRTLSFLKVTTDEGIVGWCEFNETVWNPGLTQVIRRLASTVLGEDPMQIGRLTMVLHATTRMVPGGLMQQAIAAIENACLDIKGKALGVPVYALFSGPYRQRIPLYWSHCGTFRVREPRLFETTIGTPALRTLDDFKKLGQEALRRVGRLSRLTRLSSPKRGRTGRTPVFLVPASTWPTIATGVSSPPWLTRWQRSVKAWGQRPS